MGQLLLHASGMRHAGNAISRGVRWVLVVFLVSTAVPQLARYSAHIAGGAMLEAAEAEDAGDAHAAAAARRRAETALETASPAPSPRPYTSATSSLHLPTSPLHLPHISQALSFAGHDFQLHHDLGLCHMEAGDEVRARTSFRRATELYPDCPRPHLALAMLLDRLGLGFGFGFGLGLRLGLGLELAPGARDAP